MNNHPSFGKEHDSKEHSTDTRREELFADEEDEMFADEEPADPGDTRRQAESSGASDPWKVLIVDDEEDIHIATRLALEQEVFEEKKLTILSAYSAKEARQIVAEHPDIALIFLDVVMETPYAGLEFVKYVRDVLHNQSVRIIVRTGQPGYAPEQKVVVVYDINDYKTKTDLTIDKLFTTVATGLRTYKALKIVDAYTQELEQEVQARTSELTAANQQLQREIHERKQIEDALREREENFRSIFSQSPVGIELYNKEGRLIEANRSCLDIFGVKDLDGVKGFKLFEDPNLPEDAKKRVFNGEPAHYETMFDFDIVKEKNLYATTRSGQCFIECFISPWSSGSGDPKGFLVHVMAITERKQVEEELRRYQNIVSSTPDGIAFLDEHYRYRMVNDAYERFSGVNREQFLGQTVAEYLGEKVFRQQVKPHFDRCLQGETITYQDWFDYPTLGKRFVTVTYFPYKDRHNHITGVVANTRDITAHKRAEQERLAHLRFLESMDQVNRAIQGTNDLEQMMCDVLDVVLSIFECDRAWFVYPCDPDAATWRAPMERTRPQYPGALILNLEMPVDSQVVRVYKAVLASDDPVGFGPGNEQPLPAKVAKKFNEQSQLAMAVYPKVDKPYMFGIHQCSRPRVWTQEERRFLKGIGRRLGDALTSLLIYRELRQSERLLAEITANYPHSYVSIVEHDFTIGFTSGQEFKKQHVDPRSFEGLSLEQVFGEQTPTVREHYLKAFQGEETSFELFINNQHQLYNVVPLYDLNGHITRILAVVENITERKRAEEELKKSLREKEVLLQELYHRTKNNMNVIGAMLSMQAEDIDDQRLTRILDESKQRIRTMAMVHEQLYESQDLSHVNLRAYTEQITDALLANYHLGPGNIALKVDVEPIVVLIETAIPYGIMVNELMTNALKYAFPDGRDGEIRIALRRLPGKKELELRFCDNGIGLPEDLDIRKAQSFGMKLIALLIDLQFKGTVDVQVNTGTEFRIRFQELNYKARV